MSLRRLVLWGANNVGNRRDIHQVIVIVSVAQSAVVWPELPRRRREQTHSQRRDDAAARLQSQPRAHTSMVSAPRLREHKERDQSPLPEANTPASELDKPGPLNIETRLPATSSKAQSSDQYL